MENEINIPQHLPLLPVKDIVIFPYMVLPVIVGRPASIAAVDKALSDNRLVMLVAQRDADVEEPKMADLFEIGAVGQILRMIKQPDGKVKILVQGLQRAKLRAISNAGDGVIFADIETIASPLAQNEFAAEAQMRAVKEQLIKLVGMGKPVPPDFVEMLDVLNEPEKLADILAANLNTSVDESQQFLDIIDPLLRLQKISEYFNRELSIMEVQQKIVSE
ncbi:MAG: LON peptidase substrate-binding domain-containing protein, partial [Deferribacteraceae bacterium]|nr:LON peptidase substrate-binding domain-containing protein [Deferribacteraceae bacterium]